MTLLPILMVCAAPLVMLLFGRLMQLTASGPPNPLMGFRTRLSMSSADAWNYANTYLGYRWIRQGFALLCVSIFAILLAGFLGPTGWGADEEASAWLALGILTGQLLWMGVSIRRARCHLRTIFNEDGTRIHPD